MIKIEEKIYKLKNEKTCLIREVNLDDAKEMIDLMDKIFRETDYLLRYPEEMDMTVKKEKNFINRYKLSEDNLMIVAIVNGKIVGNAQVVSQPLIKIKHRASLVISILKDYWNLGIGTFLINTLEEFSKKINCTQLELEVFSENVNARKLYKKLGFIEVVEIPNAIRFKDGSYCGQMKMVKEI